MAETMRAARYDRYGPPEVLTVRRVPVPEPRSGQVLVKVIATSVNPVETMVRSGKMRLVSGLRFPTTPGNAGKGTGEDFTGEIVAAGPGVDATAVVGRSVWGMALGLNRAAAAEYLRVKESLTAPAPEDTDLVAAAGLPLVALTALTALRTVQVTAGGRLLVVGASGGVGSATVQLARARGAHVAAVSSAANAELCAGLGAERTYDYAHPESLPAAREFDAVIDTAGVSLGTYRRLLRPGGRMVTLAVKGAPYAMTSLARPGPRVRLAQVRARRKDLNELAGHVERGELRPVVDRVYPLEEIAEAHRSLETGHGRGKRVIRI